MTSGVSNVERPKPGQKVRAARKEGHVNAHGLKLKGRPGLLSCEIIVRKTKNVKIDQKKLDEVLDRKWQETFDEVSALVEHSLL